MTGPSRLVTIVVALAGGYGLFASFVWSVDHMAVQSPLGDTLTVTHVQKAYATLNGGLFEGNLSCLELKGSCIPALRRDRPEEAFVSHSPGATPIHQRTRNRWFVPGERPATLRSDVSPSSVVSFVYVAVPSGKRPWWMTLAPWKRPPYGYCGDSSGSVCALTQEWLPPTHVNRCPSTCHALE